MAVTMHERWMRAAIERAGANPRHPFGAVVVDPRTERIVGRGVNAADRDPTAHAEVVAIRDAATHVAAEDWAHLALYTTAEPCAMCAAACLWARVGTVVYGVSVPWLRKMGWRQIDLRAEEAVRRVGRTEGFALLNGVLRTQCAALFERARNLREGRPLAADGVR